MPLPAACAQFEPFFVLSDEKLQAIVAQFRKEMEAGLAEYGHDMAMVPSFVTGVPDGNEEG
jgi:hexokinase